MTLLEQMLRQQKTAAERQKLRDAEEEVCAVILRVNSSKAADVFLNGETITLLVTDEYEAELNVYIGQRELEGDERRDVLFALVREVGG